MNLTFALVGNQNSGKSTLFNKLTGSSQHVSNFPGTTIGKTEGKLIAQADIKIIDIEDNTFYIQNNTFKIKVL